MRRTVRKRERTLGEILEELGDSLNYLVSDQIDEYLTINEVMEEVMDSIAGNIIPDKDEEVTDDIGSTFKEMERDRDRLKEAIKGDALKLLGKAVEAAEKMVAEVIGSGKCPACGTDNGTRDWIEFACCWACGFQKGKVRA